MVADLPQPVVRVVFLRNGRDTPQIGKKRAALPIQALLPGLRSRTDPHLHPNHKAYLW